MAQEPHAALQRPRQLLKCRWFCCFFCQTVCFWALDNFIPAWSIFPPLCLYLILLHWQFGQSLRRLCRQKQQQNVLDLIMSLLSFFFGIIHVPWNEWDWNASEIHRKSFKQTCNRLQKAVVVNWCEKYAGRRECQLTDWFWTRYWASVTKCLCKPIGRGRGFFSSVFSYIFVFVFSFRQQSKRPLPTTDDLLFLRVRLEIFVFSPACLSAAVWCWAAAGS